MWKNSHIESNIDGFEAEEEPNRKNLEVQVVAPTGIAALPLGGKTTFSFAGVSWTKFLLRLSPLYLQCACSTLYTRFHLGALCNKDLLQPEANN